MKEGKKAHEINVDTRISIMKPVHAKWAVSFYGEIKLKKFSTAIGT